MARWGLRLMASDGFDPGRRTAACVSTPGRRLAMINQHVSCAATAADVPSVVEDDPPAARTVKHMALTPQEWQHYSVHGFVNIGGILSDDLLQRLTQAALRIREKVRDGSLYHGFIHRTGIAAPSFPCGPQGGLGEPWLARGIFSPQHGEPVFGE
eukprot:SAG31_NODE_12911_length_907_cov_0.912129_1_plen_154_part_01